MEFILEVDELRAVIEGRRSYRKCPACMGKGFEWFCGDTGKVFADQSGDSEEYYLDLSEHVASEACETCHGLGYVVAIWED